MPHSVEIGAAEHKATVYIAGDSINQVNMFDTYPQTGIGQMLPRYFKEEYTVCDYAKNGRSTKSFIDEGRLAVIYDRITAGDYLFICFGHNDEKKEDASRYTEPFGDYQINLEKMVNVARNKHAYPLLITPLERCHFNEDGTVYEGAHGEYVKAMLELGERLDVPVINLNAMSRKIMAELGPTEARALHAFDETHLNVNGAMKYAGCVAEGLKELGGVYAELLLEEF